MTSSIQKGRGSGLFIKFFVHEHFVTELRRQPSFMDEPINAKRSFARAFVDIN